MNEQTLQTKRGNATLNQYREVENWASWLAVWMVFWANNKPRNKGIRPKVGGHQASTVSSSSILTALYLDICRPQDRVAVKPHAAPFLYSIMYMMGKLSRQEMENLREIDGPPAYPTQHHHPSFVDYSTSIEGLGCSATVADAYEARVQNLQLGRNVDARYHALVGDGELTELQIGGTLYEAGRRRLASLCWWIDLNRQSLDRIMEDSPMGSTGTWAGNLFRANGWHVIDLRWGSRISAAFNKPGGAGLRRRLESLSDTHYQALLLVDPPTARKALAGETDHDDPTMARFLEEFASDLRPPGDLEILDNYDDAEIAGLIRDLGGHDLRGLIEAHNEALGVTDRPTAIICHTIKGWRMPGLEGHPENHGAVLTEDRMNAYRKLVGFAAPDPFALPEPKSDMAAFLKRRQIYLFPVETRIPVPYPREKAPVWEEVRGSVKGKRSTSSVFGSLNLTYLRLRVGRHLAFIAPDVGLTTHLGGVILATGTFEPHPPADLLGFLREQKRQPFGWRLGEKGQFHSIGINEGVATLLAFAMGREKFAIEGKERMIPIVTIYDVFWKHAYTQLYYALYDRARFIAVGTPSGTSLSRESGTHQSVQTPAVFMGLPNIIYYEPALAFDMQVLYHWAVEQLMSPDGESVYLRLTTQEIDQPDIPDTEPMRRAVIQGGYWLLDHRDEEEYNPARNAANVFATGHVIVEAIHASELLAERGLFLNVCNVTSWERLKRDWDKYWRDPESWADPDAGYHLNELIPDDESNVPMMVVGDFTPQVADWLGTALGRSIPVLGPRDFSKTGSLESVRKLHGINARSIVRCVLHEFEMRSG